MDERQAEHDALFDADDYLFEQEQLAEQQERIAAALEEKIRAVAAERRHRREAAGKTVGGEELRPSGEEEDFGSPTRRRVGREQLRAQALTVLDKKPMGEEVLPERFRRAASRWMREERRAVLRGDFGKALEANYKARINIELARAGRRTARSGEQADKADEEIFEYGQGGP